MVDGRLGFCGGMNIRDACVLARMPRGATQDIHFRVRGPVVAQPLDAFRFDWQFTTRERLDGVAWTAASDRVGSVAARGIPDGPDEDFETLVMAILGPRIRARIAAYRDALLSAGPARHCSPSGRRVARCRRHDSHSREGQSQTRRVGGERAARAGPSWGCRVHLSQPPFDHSKMLVMDGTWCLIGSANWDPRSLRLNFEYDVECYSADLGARLNAIIDDKLARSRPLTLGELECRPLFRRLRDGIAWLAQPYLDIERLASSV